VFRVSHQDKVLDEVGDAAVGDDEEPGDGSWNSRGVSVLLGVDLGGFGEGSCGAGRVSVAEAAAVAGGAAGGVAVAVVLGGARAGDQLQNRQNAFRQNSRTQKRQLVDSVENYDCIIEE